jgi:hypothetical protein
MSIDERVNGWVRRHPRLSLVICGTITVLATTGFAMWETWYGSR